MHQATFLVYSTLRITILLVLYGNIHVYPVLSECVLSPHFCQVQNDVYAVVAFVVMSRC